MKVWQPGSSLSDPRGAKVSDWSWRQTARRVRALARLASPYKARTGLALGSLLLATGLALLPPFLAKQAIDVGIQQKDLQAPDAHRDRVPRRRGARLGRLVGADVLHRLDRRADPRRPAAEAVPAPAAPLARLLRAQQGRRDHQPPDERRRGPRPARHRRRREPRPEHAVAGRHGDHPLRPRLAARARDRDRAAADGGRDLGVPGPLDPRLPIGAGAARPGDGHARGGHRRDARRAVLRGRGERAEELPRGEPALPRGEPPDRGAERALLPVRRPALVGRDGDRARVRRAPLLRRQRHPRHAVRLHPLPGELLRPRAAAVAALQHVPRRRRRARQDHGRARRGAPGERPP